MYNIYLLRHGRSLADDEKKCEGRYDSPLTKIGKVQAKETTAYFIKNKIQFNKIITSPLMRAKETAEIINKEIKIELIEDPLLTEKDNGILAGKLYSEVNKKYPLANFSSPFTYPPQNSGENVVELHARAAMALSKIIAMGEGNYLIVSHGGLLNALVRNMLGIHYSAHKSGIYFKFIDNGLMHLQYDITTNRWIVCSMNHNQTLNNQ